MFIACFSFVDYAVNTIKKKNNYLEVWMSVYVLGAECVEDVCAFLISVSSSFRIKNFKFTQGEFFSDLEGEIDVDSTLAELVELALKVDDGHAIVESLRRRGYAGGKVTPI